MYAIRSYYDMQTNKRVIELVSKYNNIYGTIGIHPDEIYNTIDDDLDFIEKNLNNPSYNFV